MRSHRTSSTLTKVFEDEVIDLIKFDGRLYEYVLAIHACVLELNCFESSMLQRHVCHRFAEIIPL